MLKKTGKVLGYFVLSFIIVFYVLGGGIGTRVPFTFDNDTIFAHRGVLDNTVENSIESFEESKRIGFKAIETDVRLTKDKIPVIFHDESCKRLLNLDGNIEDYNWSELKDLHLFFEGKETKNPIQKLSDLLQKEAYADFIYLDIKKASIDLADALLNILSQPHKYKNVIIADENIPFIAYLRLKDDNIPIILEGFNKGKEWIHYVLPVKFQPDFYASFISQVDENHMQFLKDNNLTKRKIVYGVDKNNIKQAENFGLKHIVLDYEESFGEFPGFYLPKDIK